MKIMTYNILRGGEERLELIIDTICRERPDVLCIQEANGFEHLDYKRLRRVSSAAKLYNTAFAPGKEHSERRRYNVAMLTRYPIVSQEVLSDFHHACLLTVLKTEFGNVSFSNAHLCPSNEKTRIKEARKIIVAQERHERAIILGDLNALSPFDKYSNYIDRLPQSLQHFKDNNTIATRTICTILEAGYIDTALKTKAQRPTMPTPVSPHYHADDFRFRVDYIFVTPNLTPFFTAAQVIRSPYASDHYPYCVELKK